MYYPIKNTGLLMFSADSWVVSTVCVKKAAVVSRAIPADSEIVFILTLYYYKE